MSSPFSNCSPVATNVWQPHVVRIVSARQETFETRTYDLQFMNSPGFAYAFQPGQFNMLYLPGIGEAAISMSGPNRQDDHVVHTIRSVGHVTHALARLKVGETLGLRGPFGTGWPMDQLSGRHLVVVAGGIGLAPLRPVIYDVLTNRGQFQNVALLYGARSPDQLLYVEEYNDWRQQEVNVQCTVDHAGTDWSGSVGVVTQLLDRLPISGPSQTHVLMCGPEVMMKYVALAAIRRQIPEENLWLSLERNMNCAVGFCGHCQLGPEFICKDGPVFPFPRVRHLMEVRQF